MKRPFIIAHRGASAAAPENTMAAFKRAIEDGADGIEFDVRLARDGVPVVIHDATLERTAGLKRRVSDLTSSELAQIDVGSWFYRLHSTTGRDATVKERGYGMRSEGVPSLKSTLEFLRGLRDLEHETPLMDRRGGSPDKCRGYGVVGEEHAEAAGGNATVREHAEAAGGNTTVRECAYASLHRGVPTLVETLKFLHDFPGLLYLELKCETDADVTPLVDAVAEVISTSPLLPRMIVQSFNLNALPRMRELIPEVKTAALFDPKIKHFVRSKQRIIDAALNAGADHLSLHHSLVGPRLMAKAHAANLPVTIWTVDNPRWLTHASKLGIYAIITNGVKVMMKEFRA